jgi:Probable Zinc-ribbon domain
LAEKLPAIAAEWHPTLDADLTPADVGYASNKRAWWQCRTCGNEWEAGTYSRASGHGCRSCADRHINALIADANKVCAMSDAGFKDEAMEFIDGKWDPSDIYGFWLA